MKLVLQSIGDVELVRSPSLYFVEDTHSICSAASMSVYMRDKVTVNPEP